MFEGKKMKNKLESCAIKNDVHQVSRLNLRLLPEVCLVIFNLCFPLGVEFYACTWHTFLRDRVLLKPEH